MRIYASLYLVIFVLSVLAIFVLPFSSETASILENSLSELGAQQVPKAIVMNFLIFFLSIITTVFGSFALKRYYVQLIMLYFFTTSLFLTGVFQAAGSNPAIIYNFTQDALHALFLTLTGFAFCVFCVSLLLILKEKKQKLQTLFMLIITIIFSIVILTITDFQGIFQRLLFIGSFGWLFYAFASYTFSSRRNSFPKERIWSKIVEKIKRDEK
jgi:hypothetical membrane protein